MALEEETARRQAEDASAALENTSDSLDSIVEEVMTEAGQKIYGDLAKRDPVYAQMQEVRSLLLKK